jgi:REP element-mobilizing transposase RayT
MARPLRIEYPGAVYHLTSRGNEGRAIFTGDQDREGFLDLLHRVNRRYHWLCHAYCLMENHYHLLIETPEGNLSLGMRQLNGVYTQTFNRRHDRVGHLFQGRYKAVLIQKDSHLVEACRYIVLNPVRAKLVKRAEEWKWSSYRATAGRSQPHPCLTTNWIVGQLGDTKEGGEREYRRFVQEGIHQESIWKGVKGQSILGGEGFVKSLRPYLQGYREIPEISKEQRFLNRPSLEDLFRERTLQHREKRDKRIREAVERHGYRQREVADHIGMHFTSISRIIREGKETLRK